MRVVRAVRVSRTGGPEVLEVVDEPTPSPGPGEALVRVEAAGVNFIDVYHRRGLYKLELPARLGLEGAGVVEAVGGDASVAVGARVAWASVRGSYATHVVAPAALLVPVPVGVDAATAAALMLQGMTAHYLAHATYPLGPGKVCVIHSAAGGVGLLFCQIASRAGARVIGTVSSEAKAKLAREHGAHEVIVRGDQDFSERVKELTNGAGADVVYDSVGKDTFEKSLACLRPRGMLVMFGQSSGPVGPIDPLVLSQRGSLYLTRPTLGHYTATREELLDRAAAVLGGKLRVTIHAKLPLDKAPDAHRMLEGGGTTGKLLLVPSA